MTKLLIFLIVIVAVLVVAQLVRIFELSARLKGDDYREPTDNENDVQGKMLLAFMFLFIGGTIYLTFRYMHVFLPVSASEHGVAVDNLWDWSMGIIIAVFLITNPILFWFSYKYRGKKDAQAVHFAHSTKLELAWTVAPAVVLAGLIGYGLTTWNQIVDADTEDAVVIEVYSRQFDWTFRYAGADGILGDAAPALIEGANILGVDLNDEASNDDIVTTELHLPKDRPVLLKFRSQDVIHSAYLPHFRVQMNTVPGMVTQFAFTPTMTTEDMREETGNEEFDYILLCNKICGTAHYNMQRTVVVESEADYNAWLKEQTTLAEAGL